MAGKTTEEESEEQYDVGAETVRTTALPGSVKKKSVSVIVDLTPPAKEGEETGSGEKLQVMCQSGCIPRVLKLTQHLSVGENLTGEPAAQQEELS